MQLSAIDLKEKKHVRTLTKKRVDKAAQQTGYLVRSLTHTDGGLKVVLAPVRVTMRLMNGNNWQGAEDVHLFVTYGQGSTDTPSLVKLIRMHEKINAACG